MAVARTVGEPVLGRAHPCNGWADSSARRMHARPSAHVKLILFCLLWFCHVTKSQVCHVNRFTRLMTRDSCDMVDLSCHQVPRERLVVGAVLSWVTCTEVVIVVVVVVKTLLWECKFAQTNARCKKAPPTSAHLPTAHCIPARCTPTPARRPKVERRLLLATGTPRPIAWDIVTLLPPVMDRSVSMENLTSLPSNDGVPCQPLASLLP
ncbi:hypothetical protein O3P69_009585 [Scylla paramamosain]|uniref:Uncharacterized protein n=1 Tax=Scylla paramamosain TaxID=85552 RepID=A0AAW0SUB6_SCYPA